MNLPSFVVGPTDKEIVVRFEIVSNDGARNVQALDSLPPLNILGLRRLAKTLLEFATPNRSSEYKKSFQG